MLIGYDKVLISTLPTHWPQHVQAVLSSCTLTLYFLGGLSWNHFAPNKVVNCGQICLFLCSPSACATCRSRDTSSSPPKEASLRTIESPQDEAVGQRGQFPDSLHVRPVMTQAGMEGRPAGCREEWHHPERSEIYP